MELDIKSKEEPGVSTEPGLELIDSGQTELDSLRANMAKTLALAKELEKKNKFITDFFINISHEFKTPLSILMLGIDLIDKKAAQLPGGRTVRKHIPVMRQNSCRLNRLVYNLLDITKLDAGCMEPAWEEKDVVGCLARLVRSTEAYASQKHLTLAFSCAARDKRMVTDSFMLDRIMLNLLSNAIKHTAPGGHIEVACTVSDDRVQVYVRDTGEGIPKDKQAVIFDRFSQVNTALTRTGEGSGIGLTLTKSLVELLGGTIGFSSVPGAGSEFFFVLPVLNMQTGTKIKATGGMRLEQRVQMEMSDIFFDLETDDA